MGHRRLLGNGSRGSVTNCVKMCFNRCVWGSQGSPQGSASGPVETPGSSMIRCFQAPSNSGFSVSRAIFRTPLFALLIVVLFSGVLSRAESAGSDYKRGQTAEAREDYDAAYTAYQKAYAASPKELRYKTSYYRLRTTVTSLHVSKGRKLAEAGDLAGAMAEFLRAAEVDPGNESAQQEIARLRLKQGEKAPASETSLPIETSKQDELDSIGSPSVLKPVSNEPLTLHMTEDSKVIYQAVGKAAGVNVLFDPDYNSKRVQVDLNNVSLLDALRIIGTISNTFWRSVTSNTIFVAANTRAKRTELDEQAVQTFYLANAWQQNDLNDVQTALRNVLPNAKVYGVASQNAIVMRGTPDELLLASKLVNDLDKARPEVVVDIAVLEVNKNWEKKLGLAWPSSATVALQSTSTTTTTSGTTTTTSTDTPTVYDLANLKSSNLAVTIGSATANLLLSDSNTKILQNPRVRCTDGQKATMKIGSRIPIATGSYSTGTSTTTTSSLVNTQFQYIDVGVNVEMTPTIHYNHDVTLKIKLEDSSENGSVTISSVTEPIIAQKTSEQVIRLREGEASVLSGMVNTSDSVSWSGVPGLSSIPFLKYLFGSKDHTIVEDEIVFLLIPHIVRTQDIGSTNLRAIDTGVGTSIDLRHVPSEGSSTTPASTPAAKSPASSATPAGAARSQVGTVPGQSAQAAAPAALAQMRAAAESNGELAAVAAKASSPSSQSAAVSFALNPSSSKVTAGSDFQVPIVLNGGKDITGVPLQISYDPAKLTLINVDSGELLKRDGQAVALVHRDDGPGSITLNVSRPPGTAGVSGSGVVCVLSFQAKAAGASQVSITRPAAINSAQQTVAGTGAQTTIQVQ
jgi:general secretion pathway protein D